MLFSRRKFLRSLASSGFCTLGLSSVLTCIPTRPEASEDPSRDGSVLDILVHQVTPRLTMFNKHTRESIDLVFYDPDYGYFPEAISKIDWIMRDWRQSEVKEIDARLIWGLATLSHAVRADGHDGTIGLNSGYRTKKTNSSLEGAARNSLHLKGKAADFTFDGIPTSAIAKYATWLDIGGVGHYPNRFVHIDAGRERNWVG